MRGGHFYQHHILSNIKSYLILHVEYMCLVFFLLEAALVSQCTKVTIIVLCKLSDSPSDLGISAYPLISLSQFLFQPRSFVLSTPPSLEGERRSNPAGWGRRGRRGKGWRKWGGCKQSLATESREGEMGEAKRRVK